ncbi:hypothetical protein KP509_39G049900 [Ceratopteris richardii]|nr:hypothetical protein KP509_39G049900 [Ceratopteris richardii]
MIILDVRNIYETRIGKFVPPEDIECLDPQIRQYSDLPQWIDSNAERLRNKSILMYCTGGVRCEMASAYIKKKGSGFQNVFQLSGGIQRYLETFPDGGFFKGKNFVFDHRVAVPSVCPDILGACTKCGVPFDDYTSRVRCSHCRMLVLVCNDCQARLVSEGQPQTQLCEICTANKSVKNCDLNNQLVLTSNGMCPDKAVHLEKSNESTNRHISAGCTDLRVSANGAVRRKLRILCLHGFRQSASSLKGRLAAFTKKLKGFAEFVFIDAPHEVPLIVTNAKENDYGQSTSRCQTAGKMPGKKFAWLVTPEMTSRTSSAVLVSDTILMSRNERGFDKDQYKRQTLGWISSLRKLEEVFNDQGRFDGVLGFSQGAAVAASLCISSESTLQEKSSIKFRFAILCSGFISPASEMQDLMAHVSLPLKCPSLHIYADSGGHDRQIVNTDSMQLKALFDPGTAMVLTHNLGHILPSHRDDMEKVKQFLSQFI